MFDGHGHVEVHLERAGVSIACEMSVSTRADHEIQNVSNCLSAGFVHVVLTSSTEKMLTSARAVLDQHDGRARFVSPNGFSALLGECELRIDREAAKRSEAPAQRPHDSSDASASKLMLISEDAAKYLGIAT